MIQSFREFGPEIIATHRSLMLHESCKRFKECAVVAFQRKFGSNPVTLYCTNTRHIYEGITDQDYDEGVDWIRIGNPKMLFPFIRVFDAKIAKLVVNLTSASMRLARRGNDHINKYCSSAVGSPVFLLKPRIPNDYAIRFPMVTELHMNHSRVKEQLLYFVVCFPNLKKSTINAHSFDVKL